MSVETTTPDDARSSAQLFIVTGMSGAGRSTVANVLEDRGWYVIDNLPPQMLVPMIELLEDAEADENTKMAAVVDVRSRGLFTSSRDGIDRLRDHGWQPTVLFVDATDESLVRRFESVRRPHPLQSEGRLLDGIVTERELLRDLRSNADLLIDTSGLNVHKLSAKVQQLIGGDGRPALRLAVMSFGFKYGIPLDADLVFDMRFLPNPFWNPEMRPLTGQDSAVAEFVLGQPGAPEFIDGTLQLLKPMTEGYLREGRSYVTLAVGCTGGKHRSVAVAEELSRRIAAAYSTQVGTLVVHRDLGRE